MNNNKKINLSPIKEMELRASRIPGVVFLCMLSVGAVFT
jgi:hypothetical protein